ncbi:MAG: PEGA domain-containing protein [Candidatus Omnitrophica bacterium]|nr:PEGA domain-containing protein [Candidatus Omnitrophota bacterium]
MPRSDRILRFIAFYLSVLIFFITLPILLSYSLGYKIDYRNFKIYKTGIIYLSSHPSGASVYVNGRLYKDFTPAQIEELKPGSYKIEVKREGFYPWEGELAVRPNMVTKADRIELFPVTREMKRLSDREISDFAVSDRGYVYYFTKSGLFRTGMDKSPPRKISSFSNWPDRITGKKFSPDSGKLLYFNENAVTLVNLNPDKFMAKVGEGASVEEIFKSPDPIMDVFWYPGLNYIVVVTEKDIKAVELRGGATRNIASLYKFAAKPQSLFYDENSDSLYFTDIKIEPGLMNRERYLYRLDLRQTFLDSLRELLLKKETVTENEKR